MRPGVLLGARYWDRTSDLFRVREARYRCANRAYTGCSVMRRGGDGIRTRVNGFAGRCLAARPRHRDVVRPTCRDSPPVSQTEIPPLERMTRLELATPTLARLCATNCATSAFRSRGLPRALVRHYPILAKVQNHARPARVSLDGRNGLSASARIVESRSGRRAIGAVGSALPSHGRGHQFESGIAHHENPRETGGFSFR